MGVGLLLIFNQIRFEDLPGFIDFDTLILLLRPVVEILQNPTAGWLTLAATSTLAGNLTLLGSVANLIVAEIADRYQVNLPFWEYTKAGVIITVLSLKTGVLYI
jgi:Na+/H+ antiporter NhaD/arsenite permease-like protein